MFNLLDPRWIQAATPGSFWFWAVMVWAVAVVGLVAAFRYFARSRLIEDTPQSLIRSAAQGYVEFQGQAALMPGPPIVAPLTTTPCVWWSYKVEERRRDRGRTDWSAVSGRTSDDLFFIQDQTGHCVVDPEHAEVHPAVRQIWYGETPEPLGGPQLGSFAIGSRYRYVEERIHSGDPLYALGYFHTQGPPSVGDINEEVRQLLVAWKKDQAELLRRFDTNHDGQIDQQEWDAARAEARREVLQNEREAMARPPVNVLSRSPDGRPFILSTAPQKKLESRLRLWATACLLVFFLAGALGTYLVSARVASSPAASNADAP